MAAPGTMAPYRGTRGRGMVVEFLVIIVVGVLFVVQFAMKQSGKDDSSGSSLWGGGSGSGKSSRQRPPARPRPQTPQSKSLDEALRLSEARQAPPTMQYAGLDQDDDGPAADLPEDAAAAPGRAPKDVSAAPGDVPVLAEVPWTELDVSDRPDYASDRVVRAEGETEPAGAEPAELEQVEPSGIGTAEPLRPAEPFSPAYSASVYTPTSVYSSYTPASLYTSGTSILDGEQQADPQQEEPGTGPGVSAREPGLEEDQRP